MPAAESAYTLDEVQSKSAVAAFGLQVPHGRVVDNAREAARAARELGYPVAVKAVSAHISHKTEAGAVVLGCEDEAAVCNAVEVIARSTGATAGAPARFLVERMVESPVAELIVGVTRDAQFGPVLLVGSGGVLVEMLQDSRTLLLPVRREDVSEAIASLKTSALLDGFRGRPAGDREAAVEAVLAVGRFAEAHADTLLELDINPLMVLARGRGAVAADALIRLAGPGPEHHFRRDP